MNLNHPANPHELPWVFESACGSYAVVTCSETSHGFIAHEYAPGYHRRTCAATIENARAHHSALVAMMRKRIAADATEREHVGRKQAVLTLTVDTSKFDLSIARAQNHILTEQLHSLGARNADLLADRDRAASERDRLIGKRFDLLNRINGLQRELEVVAGDNRTLELDRDRFQAVAIEAEQKLTVANSTITTLRGEREEWCQVAQRTKAELRQAAGTVRRYRRGAGLALGVLACGAAAVAYYATAGRLIATTWPAPASSSWALLAVLLVLLGCVSSLSRFVSWARRDSRLKFAVTLDGAPLEAAEDYRLERGPVTFRLDPVSEEQKDAIRARYDQGWAVSPELLSLSENANRSTAKAADPNGTRWADSVKVESKAETGARGMTSPDLPDTGGVETARRWLDLPPLWRRREVTARTVTGLVPYAREMAEAAAHAEGACPCNKCHTAREERSTNV